MRSSSRCPYLIDIAVNLTDCVFRGCDWKGKQVHEDDFDLVLERAAGQNVHQMIITGTSLAQSEKAIAMCKQCPDKKLLCTVGVHPAHSAEFRRPLQLEEVQRIVSDKTAMVLPSATSDPSLASEVERQVSTERLRHLVQLIEENRDVVVAVGEIGIDYAELSCCPRETQEKYFLEQLRAFSPLGLPFLLHSRECGPHFLSILTQFMDSTVPPTSLCGVVHSFNGNLEEQEKLLEMGFYLSLNGSAFREESLAAQVVQIPLDRLLLETDAPWCDVRSKDYGDQYVTTRFVTAKKKNQFKLGACLDRRNEPCHLTQVVEAYLGCRAALLPSAPPVTKEELTQILFDNCCRVFNL